MNDAQQNAWKHILGMIDTGEILDAVQLTITGSDVLKVVIDGQECILHLDGSLTTMVRRSVAGQITTAEIDDEHDVVIAARLLKKLTELVKKSDEYGLDYDRVTFEFSVVGKKTWTYPNE